MSTKDEEPLAYDPHPYALPEDEEYEKVKMEFAKAQAEYEDLRRREEEELLQREQEFLHTSFSTEPPTGCTQRIYHLLTL
jgi:hypothetical protein